MGALINAPVARSNVTTRCVSSTSHHHPSTEHVAHRPADLRTTSTPEPRPARRPARRSATTNVGHAIPNPSSPPAPDGQTLRRTVRRGHRRLCPPSCVATHPRCPRVQAPRRPLPSPARHGPSDEASDRDPYRSPNPPARARRRDPSQPASPPRRQRRDALRRGTAADADQRRSVPVAPMQTRKQGWNSTADLPRPTSLAASRSSSNYTGTDRSAARQRHLPLWSTVIASISMVPVDGEAAHRHPGPRGRGTRRLGCGCAAWPGRKSNQPEGV